MARDSLDSKFRMRSDGCKEEISKLLVDMPEEEDWYYGAAMRLEGSALLQRGQQLEDDRRVLEAEAAVKIHKIKTDLSAHSAVRSEEIERERKAFEVKIEEKNDRVRLDIEIRTAELERLKVSKAAEFAAKEKAAKMELGVPCTMCLMLC